VRFREVERSGFDGVEVANSAQVPFGIVTGFNRNLAEKTWPSSDWGSDSHIPETFGRSYTVVETDSREPMMLLRGLGRVGLG